MVHSITLSGDVESAIARKKIATNGCNKKSRVLCVQNDVIQFQSHRVLCCWRRICCGNGEITLTAFQKHLAVKYGAEDSFGTFLAENSVKLAHLPGRINVFCVDDARKIHKYAQEINRRYKDLDNLVKWLRWYKIYRESSSKKEEENQVFGMTPKEKMVKDRKGTVQSYKFKDIYERLLEIPFEGDVEFSILRKVDDAVRKTLKDSDSFVIPTSRIIEIVVKQLRVTEMEEGVNIQIKTPPKDLLDKELRESIQDKDSVEDLTSEELEKLLAKQGDYVKPYRNEHRVSIHSTRVLNDYDQQSKSFFSASVSDV